MTDVAAGLKSGARTEEKKEEEAALASTLQI